MQRFLKESTHAASGRSNAKNISKILSVVRVTTFQISEYILLNTYVLELGVFKAVDIVYISLNPKAHTSNYFPL